MNVIEKILTLFICVLLVGCTIPGTPEDTCVTGLKEVLGEAIFKVGGLAEYEINGVKKFSSEDEAISYLERTQSVGETNAHMSGMKNAISKAFQSGDEVIIVEYIVSVNTNVMGVPLASGAHGICNSTGDLLYPQIR